MSQSAIGELTDEQQRDLLFACSKAFSPSAPIQTEDLFAGRINEMARIFAAVNTRGQHAIVFGERGVGKTSLANLARLILHARSAGLVVPTNCMEGDSFGGIWERILSNISTTRVRANTMGFQPETITETRSALEAIKRPVLPGDVHGILEALSRDTHVVIMIDEFDRIHDVAQKVQFADTIKWLSDSSANVTIVLVGVALDVESLIGSHASIERALVQIQMPRMTVSELTEIIDKALAHDDLKMTIDPKAKDTIVFLSQGFPHYTHVLGIEAAKAAILERSRNITAAHVETGIRQALEDKKQTVGKAYQNAVSSQRKDSLFKVVLLACAMAEVDEFGSFATTDIREPLNDITGRNYDIENYLQHLVKFSMDETRGPALERIGEPRRYRFRFRNPLLQPYVIMRGINETLLSESLLESLLRRHKQAPSRDSLF